MGLRDKLRQTKSRYTHQIIGCPACSQKLRVPVRLGKTLMINCSRCRNSFQVKIPHPLQEAKKRISDIFSWDPHRGLFNNVQNSIKKIIFILRHTPFGKRFFAIFLYVGAIFLLLKFLQ